MDVFSNLAKIVPTSSEDGLILGWRRHARLTSAFTTGRRHPYAVEGKREAEEEEEQVVVMVEEERVEVEKEGRRHPYAVEGSREKDEEEVVVVMVEEEVAVEERGGGIHMQSKEAVRLRRRRSKCWCR